MMGKLLAWDVKPKGVAVVMIHPGFLRTDMTVHYSHLYDELGAVPAEKAVKPILQTVENLTLENTGRFIAPMGSAGLGLGVWALPDPDNFGPFSELPW
jgi:NAD(P)-dependent dehydrogenase (short-subunit alcohol dehydrogenase family)